MRDGACGLGDAIEPNIALRVENPQGPEEVDTLAVIWENRTSSVQWMWHLCDFTLRIFENLPAQLCESSGFFVFKKTFMNVVQSTNRFDLELFNPYHHGLYSPGGTSPDLEQAVTFAERRDSCMRVIGISGLQPVAGSRSRIVRRLGFTTTPAPGHHGNR